MDQRPQARNAPRLPRTQLRSWAARDHERAPTPNGVAEVAPRARCAACRAPNHEAQQTQCTASCTHVLTGHEQANAPAERKCTQVARSRHKLSCTLARGTADTQQALVLTLPCRSAVSPHGTARLREETGSGGRGLAWVGPPAARARPPARRAGNVYRCAHAAAFVHKHTIILASLSAMHRSVNAQTMRERRSHRAAAGAAS